MLGFQYLEEKTAFSPEGVTYAGKGSCDLTGLTRMWRSRGSWKERRDQTRKGPLRPDSGIWNIGIGELPKILENVAIKGVGEMKMFSTASKHLKGRNGCRHVCLDVPCPLHPAFS